MSQLSRYRLKKEFKEVFKNLSDVEKIWMVDDLFEDQNGAPRGKAIRSQADIDKNDNRRALLKKLIDAGFVDDVPISFDVKEKT